MKYTLIRKIYNKLCKIIYNTICTSPICPVFVRLLWLKFWGADIASNDVEVLERIYINSSKLYIGDGVHINTDCKIYNSSRMFEEGNVIFKGNCNVGFNVTFCTISHEIGTPERRAKKHLDKDIIIGQGV